MSSLNIILSITGAAVSFLVGIYGGIIKFHKEINADKITLKKGNKSITISSKFDKEDINRLAHF